MATTPLPPGVTHLFTTIVRVPVESAMATTPTAVRRTFVPSCGPIGTYVTTCGRFAATRVKSSGKRYAIRLVHGDRRVIGHAATLREANAAVSLLAECEDTGHMWMPMVGDPLCVRCTAREHETGGRGCPNAYALI